MCGGTIEKLADLPKFQGLSPRVRGNRLQCAPPPEQLGSIPACAGEPEGHLTDSPTCRVYPRVCGGTLSGRTPTPTWTGVYPRVCGGTEGPNRSKRYHQGLSPRVRGNHFRIRLFEPFRGSIPACAGEPGAEGRGGDYPGVYPRVCGGTAEGKDLHPHH